MGSCRILFWANHQYIIVPTVSLSIRSLLAAASCSCRPPLQTRRHCAAEAAEQLRAAEATRRGRHHERGPHYQHRLLFDIFTLAGTRAAVAEDAQAVPPGGKVPAKVKMHIFIAASGCGGHPSRPAS